MNKEKNAYKKRLSYEISIIEKMGFEGYYLMVWSYANSVKRRGIARGSGGGSLVAYLLNIVDTDPVEYVLYFERFIDVGSLQLLEDGKINEIKQLKIPDFINLEKKTVIKCWHMQLVNMVQIEWLVFRFVSVYLG